MDIRRILVDDQFKYINSKTRKRITDKKTLKRIANMRIPPAYKKIKISKKANDKVQAIGVDEAGRKQYIYSKKFVQEQQEIKFQDLIQFGKKIKRIRKDVKYHISKNTDIYDRSKVISMVIYLMDHCNFRIGTEEYKKLYNTYGATTLNKNHIIFKENEAEIRFVGKKSVENVSTIRNPVAINLLKQLCQRHGGKEFLFYYKDEQGEIHQVSSSQINNFLKKYNKNLIPKMFRTWNGNNVLLRHLISKSKPENEKEIKTNLRDAIKKVANELHNTVAVAKKSYLNSEIYTTYLMDNDKFFEFLEKNKRENGDNKTTDRILTLFLIEYYKDLGK
jgi:DNA topoisomerase I